MAELLRGDMHEVTAKLAYQLWEQRGRPFGSLRWIGSLPKRHWPQHNAIRNWIFHCTESRWKRMKGRSFRRIRK